MRLKIIALSLSMALAGLGATSAQKPPAGNVAEIKDCYVSLIEEAQVPGREPGALVEVKVKEGMEVKTGDILARIDDSEPAMQKQLKQIELATAREKADDDIDVRFSRKATEVSKVEWEKAEESNKRTPGSVVLVEINRLKLTYEKAKLQIEKAQLDQRLASLAADAKAKEVEAADLSMQRRLLRAPLDGVVVKVNRHEGEWVPPGDAVVHVVRVNRLRVEGFLNVAKYDPRKVKDRSVVVEVQLSDNQTAKFSGQVVFVSPLVEAGGEYRVWAEVDNRKEQGDWVLHPGTTATMTIQLK